MPLKNSDFIEVTVNGNLITFNKKHIISVHADKGVTVINVSYGTAVKPFHASNTYANVLADLSRDE